MQIYFHRHLFSHLSRVPILVEGTVIFYIVFYNFFVSVLVILVHQMKRWEMLFWQLAEKFFTNILFSVKGIFFKVLVIVNYNNPCLNNCRKVIAQLLLTKKTRNLRFQMRKICVPKFNTCPKCTHKYQKAIVFCNVSSISEFAIWMKGPL